MTVRLVQLALVAFTSLGFGACTTLPWEGGLASAWQTNRLARALSDPSRPQADRERDADRKPAELMAFLGVEPAMVVVDVIGAGGYLTEVLSIAVGPEGKVYVHNPPLILKMRDGAYDKALTARLEGERLANVVRVDADLPTQEIPPGTVDVAITAMNFHDVYHMGGVAAAQAFMRSVYTMLEPGGVFGVIDHVGEEGADNAKLHRIAPQVVIDMAEETGFIVDATSDLLANPADDHTLGPFDPSIRGKTDQFVLKLKRPGKGTTQSSSNGNPT